MKRLPWILLGLSIIFNFAFAGGYLQARNESGDPDGAADQGQAADLVAKRFNLTEQQREDFVALKARLRDEAQSLHDAIALARQELWAVTADPSSTPAAIQDAQQRVNELYEQGRMLRFEHFRRFMAGLSPDQRQEVIGQIRRQEFRGRLGQQLRERFDADGDGVLDAAERQKAREAVRQRRERMENRNGNGPAGGGMRGRRGPTNGEPNAADGGEN